MGLIDVYNFKWNHSEKMTETRIGNSLSNSSRFTAPGESFAVEFVVTKHFAWESLHVELSCGLDIVVYMLNQGAFYVYSTPKLRQGRTFPRRTH